MDVRAAIPDVTLYAVLADFGRHGRAWVEREAETADSRACLVGDLMSGEIARPIAIHARNVVEGWARDVTVEVAEEVMGRTLAAGQPVSVELKCFLEEALGSRARGLRIADALLCGSLLAAE